MEKENFKKFVISLYKPVKFLTITMILSMVIAQILDLVKQLAHISFYFQRTTWNIVVLFCIIITKNYKFL